MLSLYFEWLLKNVCNEEDKHLYNNLLSHLFYKNFEWIRPLDKNCAVHALDLREEWLKKHYNFEVDDKPCCILEVLVSLAIQIEDVIMSNDVFGDRTSYWFWLMIENLGLIHMDDRYYNEEKVDEILEIFLKREYEKNGKGGLFVINDRNIDMRSCDIWQQAMGFLRKYVENDGEIY